MTFHILANSTTADATDENDNFYHIGQGSRLPMGGQSLTATDGVYDLGSSSTAWNNIYANNIFADVVVSDSSGLWLKIVDETLASSTPRWEITGIDAADVYMFYLFIPPDSTRINGVGLHFNGDSASNYGYQILISDSSSGSLRLAGGNHIRLWSGGALTDTSSFISGVIYAKTGNERLVLNDYIGGLNVGTTTSIYNSTGQIWNNTTDTITSFIFTHNVYVSSTNIIAGAHLIVFKKG